jgi:hypothetical protein
LHGARRWVRRLWHRGESLLSQDVNSPDPYVTLRFGHDPSQFRHLAPCCVYLTLSPLDVLHASFQVSPHHIRVGRTSPRSEPFPLPDTLYVCQLVTRFPVRRLVEGPYVSPMSRTRTSRSPSTLRSCSGEVLRTPKGYRPLRMRVWLATYAAQSETLLLRVGFRLTSALPVMPIST